MDHPIRFAPADLYREALHRHHQFQRPHPFDRHPRGILAGKVVKPSTIFPLDRFSTLLFASALRITLGQRQGTPLRLMVQVVVISVQSVLIASKTPPQPLDKWVKRRLQPGRQRRRW